MSRRTPRFRRVLLTAFLSGCLLMLASCLPVPLGDPETSQVDPKLVGAWTEVENADTGNLYVIAAFDKHGYVVQCVSYTRKGEAFEAKSTTWRAWLTEIKGTRFITFQDIPHMADPNWPGGVTYPIAKIELDGNLLTATGLDAGYAKFNEIRDAAALGKVVEENLADPMMYLEKRIVLRRMDAANAADAELMKLAVP